MAEVMEFMDLLKAWLELRDLSKDLKSEAVLSEMSHLEEEINRCMRGEQ